MFFLQIPFSAYQTSLYSKQNLFVESILEFCIDAFFSFLSCKSLDYLI